MARTPSAQTIARIEENSARFSKARLHCPVCGSELGVRVDRRGKPYISCLPCGAQLFVRKDEGIERLLRRVSWPRRGSPTASAQRPRRVSHPLLERAAHG